MDMLTCIYFSTILLAFGFTELSDRVIDEKLERDGYELINEEDQMTSSEAILKSLIFYLVYFTPIINILIGLGLAIRALEYDKLKESYLQQGKLHQIDEEDYDIDDDLDLPTEEPKKEESISFRSSKLYEPINTQTKKYEQMSLTEKRAYLTSLKKELLEEIHLEERRLEEKEIYTLKRKK